MPTTTPPGVVLCVTLACCAFCLVPAQDINDILDDIPIDVFTSNVTGVPDVECATRAQSLATAVSGADTVCSTSPCSFECLDYLDDVNKICDQCFADQCPSDLQSINTTEIAEQCEDASNQLCTEIESSFYNCSQDCEMTAGWCRYQNPFIVPRPLQWPTSNTSADTNSTDYQSVVAEYQRAYECVNVDGDESDDWDAACRMVDAFSSVEVTRPGANDADGSTFFIIAKMAPDNSSDTVLVSPVTNTEIWSDLNTSKPSGRVLLQGAIQDVHQSTNFFLVQVFESPGSSQITIRYFANTLSSVKPLSGVNSTTVGSDGFVNLTNRSEGPNPQLSADNASAPRFDFSVSTVTINATGILPYRGFNHNDKLLSFIADGFSIVGVPFSFKGTDSSSASEMNGILMLRLHNGSIASRTLLWELASFETKILSVKATKHHWNCSTAGSEDLEDFFTPNHMDSTTTLDSSCTKSHSVVAVTTRDQVGMFHFDPSEYEWNGSEHAILDLSPNMAADNPDLCELSLNLTVADSVRVAAMGSVEGQPLLRYSIEISNASGTSNIVPLVDVSVGLDQQPWLAFDLSNISASMSDAIDPESYNIGATELLTNQWPKFQSPFDVSSYIDETPPSAQDVWLIVVLNPVDTNLNISNGTAPLHARVLTLALSAFSSMTETSQPMVTNPAGLQWVTSAAFTSTCDEPNCQRGLDCDFLSNLASFNYTCESLERYFGCDCAGCACSSGDQLQGHFSDSFPAYEPVDDYTLPEPEVRIVSMTSAWRSVPSQLVDAFAGQNLTQQSSTSTLDQFTSGDVLPTDVSTEDASDLGSSLIECLQSENPSDCAVDSVSGYQDAVSGLDIDSDDPLSGLLSLLTDSSASPLSSVGDFDTDDASRLYGLRYILHLAAEDRGIHSFHAFSLPPICPHATVPVSSGTVIRSSNNTVGSDNISFVQTVSNSSQSVAALNLVRVNTLSVLGNVDSMSSSPNGQHLFIKTTRELWELQAMERVVEVCARLSEDISDLFLESFIPACFEAEDDDSVPRYPRPDDFVMATSACITGTLCTSFNNENVTEIADGYYTDYHFDVGVCEAGYFCQNGIQIECPRGYYCPTDGLSLPLRCAFDPTHLTTCFEEGLKQPAPCPDGYICYAPHLPPIAAAPGSALVEVQESGPKASPDSFAGVQEQIQALYKGTDELGFSTTSQIFRLQSIRCAAGTWCPIGRHLVQEETLAAQGVPTSTADFLDQLGCPAGYFCSSSDVSVPTLCDVETAAGESISCPQGSVEMGLCPAGNFCRSPSGDQFSCTNGSFCPAGSMVAQLCTAGSYCPNVTTRLPCPAGTFCPEGSMQPIVCSSLDVCPSGSAVPIRLSLFLVVASVISLVVGVALCVPKTPSDGGPKRAAVTALPIQSQKRSLRHRRRKRGVPVRDFHSNEDSPSVYRRDADLSPFRGVELTDLGSVEPDSPRHGDNAIGATLQGDGLDVTSLEQRQQELDVVDISFVDLGLRLNASKGPVCPPAGDRRKPDTASRAQPGVILQGVTGTLHGGRATAVMGPSGAGKTTFITTLTSKAHYGTRSGRVMVNGRDDDLRRYRTVTGFVPQDDIMMTTLTARENLLFSARARLPWQKTADEVTNIVHDTLHLLGLWEQRNDIVANISSGKRKAVNIGLELVAQPRLLFVDEPTTGLDSTSSLAICTMLHEIAMRGLTVVAVVHQPRYDAFCKFDDVLLLGKGGRTVYLGPTDRMIPYFSMIGFDCPPRANPADFVLDVVAGQHVRHTDMLEGDAGSENHPANVNLFDLWTERGASFVRDCTDEVQNEPSTVVVGTRSQLGLVPLCWLYICRSFLQQRRALMSVVADFAVVFFAGAFLGILYFDKSQGRGNTHSTFVDAASGDDECEHCSWMSLGDPAESFFGCPAVLAEQLPTVSLALGDQILSRGSMCCIAVGLTSVTAFMKVFSNERTVYFRENAGLATYVLCDLLM